MKQYLKQKLHGEVIFCLCILAYILYILIACIGYRAYTRYIPLIVGTVSLVMIIYVLIKAWRTKPENVAKMSGYFEVFLWAMLCPVLIYFLGFMVGGPIYCFLFSKLRVKEKWLPSIIPAVVIGVFLYALYNLLRVNLYGGLLFSL
jgi:hypothetical protein